jgi:hypothetical protein
MRGGKLTFALLAGLVLLSGAAFEADDEDDDFAR